MQLQHHWQSRPVDIRLYKMRSTFMDAKFINVPFVTEESKFLFLWNLFIWCKMEIPSLWVLPVEHRDQLTPHTPRLKWTILVKNMNRMIVPSNKMMIQKDNHKVMCHLTTFALECKFIDWGTSKVMAVFVGIPLIMCSLTLVAYCSCRLMISSIFTICKSIQLIKQTGKNPSLFNMLVTFPLDPRKGWFWLTLRCINPTEVAPCQELHRSVDKYTESSQPLWEDMSWPWLTLQAIVIGTNRIVLSFTTTKFGFSKTKVLAELSREHIFE